MLPTGPARQCRPGKLPAVPFARALTRRPSRGTLVPLLASLAAVTVALAGCGHVDAALSKQWATVNFKPDTTTATVAKVRQACSHVPHLRPLPASAVSSELDIRYSVRYEVEHASGQDFAALKACLGHFPAVSGVSITDIATG